MSDKKFIYTRALKVLVEADSPDDADAMIREYAHKANGAFGDVASARAATILYDEDGYGTVSMFRDLATPNHGGKE